MLTDRIVCSCGRRRRGSVAFAGPTRRTRWRAALARGGGILVLAALAGCASPERATTGTTRGPYVAARPEAFAGKAIGAGHCVDFVTAAAGAPPTALWREG